MLLQGLLFVARRVLGLVVTVAVASIAIFAVLAIAPGDPAAALAGGSVPNPATLAAIREQFRLDEPIVVRYLGWLGDVLTGDFGRSFVYRADVADLIAPRIGTTLLLVAYSAAIILIVGIGSGVLAALGGRIADRAVTAVASVAMGAPTFVVAIFLIALFAVTLDWFPVFGSGVGFWDSVHHLTLPAVAMSFAYLAFVSRLTRSAVRTELYSEHVDTARSRGIRPRHYLMSDVLRNATPQVLAVSGITIASLFAATAVAEQAFGVNGIGSLMVEAAARQDLPVVQLLSLFMVVAFVVINTLVDIANALIDPRTVAKGSNA
jgi:peptide/nickel transport system permease protein